MVTFAVMPAIDIFCQSARLGESVIHICPLLTTIDAEAFVIVSAWPTAALWPAGPCSFTKPLALVRLVTVVKGPLGVGP